jgi:hypothetical protein
MAVFRDVMHRFRRFHPGATWDEFAKAAARTDEGRRAIAAWHRARKITAFPEAKRTMVGALLARHRAARTIVFVADNPTAYAISREHLIMPLTCDIKRKERERVLGLFKEGKLRALVSAQVLNEGLDVPDAEVGIIVAGSKGEREHVQRVGRVLRPRPGKRAWSTNWSCARRPRSNKRASEGAPLLPESAIPFRIVGGRVLPGFLDARDVPWLRVSVEEIDRFRGLPVRELA